MSQCLCFKVTNMCLFYKMKSLDCLATHFDVTRDTQKCRDTLFENHWYRVCMCVGGCVDEREKEKDGMILMLKWWERECYVWSPPIQFKALWKQWKFCEVLIRQVIWNLVLLVYFTKKVRLLKNIVVHKWRHTYLDSFGTLSKPSQNKDIRYRRKTVDLYLKNIYKALTCV